MRETMYYNSAKLLAVVLLVLAQWHIVTVSGAEQGCWEEERLALLQIYATLTIPIHSAEGEWKGTDCCRWEGVTCDHTTGHVTELDLSTQLDSDGREYYYAGEFLKFHNATIFLPLHQLKYLSLSHHDMTGLMAGAGVETWSNLTKLEVLDLSGNQLNGNIIFPLARISSLRKLILNRNYNYPDSGAPMEGLCRMKNLEELDLSENSLTGNLPPCIGNLSSLQILDLAYNQFKVKFPSPTFERLMSLRYLSLSYNQLEGSLSMRSFLNHSNLEILGLSTVALNFRVKVVHLPFQLKDLELSNCKIDVDPTFFYSQQTLQVLDLSNTQSKGPIPVGCLLENNTNLIQLDLHKNFFTGPLQFPFLIHEKLEMLDVSNNHLDGELPIDIATKLPNLLYLNLSVNYFHGPLPSMAMRNIFTLDVSVNNFSDDINNIFSKTFSLLPFVLDLSYNNFYGYFTNNINYTWGYMLVLNDNSISGNLPSSICNVTLDVLDISNNKLNGVLPGCVARTFSSLKLSQNHLEGPLPSKICGQWLLDLSENKISGSIPSCSNHSIANIVNLSHNNLTGKLPKTWLNSSRITFLDVQDNHLSGELPIWMGNKSNLRILQASENLFEGHIPEQICQFKYLRILDLSQNNLSGQIPPCIFHMGKVDAGGFYVNAGGNVDMFKPVFGDTNILLNIKYGINFDADKTMNYGLELMSKGRSDLYWEKILQLEGAIDLSSNNLFGNIPKEIGQMSWLITLNLSNNHLAVAIPNSMSNLSQLLSLDLSHNSLTGEIPRDLTKLTYLEYFSVAYNNLSGPTLGNDSQFITFNGSSYEGNPNLCGPPLSKSCFPTLDTFPSVSKDKRHEGTDFLILFSSFSLFFVISFWCFMAVLYFKRDWRYALFTLVDQYSDMIYVRVVLLVRKIGAARTERDS